MLIKRSQNRYTLTITFYATTAYKRRPPIELISYLAYVVHDTYCSNNLQKTCGHLNIYRANKVKTNLKRQVAVGTAVQHLKEKHKGS